MSIKTKIVLAGLAIIVLAGLAITLARRQTKLTGESGPGQHHGQKNNRVFRVYIYSDPAFRGQCFADRPVLTLWTTKNQKVVWVSDDGAEYTVDFTQGHHQSAPGHNPSKSPFASLTFDVPPNGEMPSGLLSSDVHDYYDFAIRAGDKSGPICKQTGDPGLIVKP